jgi:ribosomal protein S18 acetylase RimI-like enzyme
VDARAESRRVRLVRRTDVAALPELRLRAHAGVERGGKHDVSDAGERARLVAGTRLLVESEAVSVFVAEADAHAADGGGALVGYAFGRHAVWPPIWRTQRVGEIVETYVAPGPDAPRLLTALVGAVTTELSRRDVEVLRARVACDDRETRARFEAIGFTPLMRTFVRRAEHAPASDDLLEIRAATASDVPGLVLLSLAMLEENGRHEPRLTPHPDAAASLATRHLEEVSDPRSVVFVAEEKRGLPIGMAVGQLGRGDGHKRPTRDATITACFVVPPRRRRGLARRLADRAAEALVSRGADELRLHVVAKNAGSLAFWSSLGYEPVEELLDRPTIASVRG